MPRPRWFWTALVAQLLLVLLIPASRWLILATGRSVVLETEPYDPYNSFSGYYVDLRYKIANPAALPVKLELKESLPYFVVLKAGTRGIWSPVRVAEYYPRNLARNEVALRGKLHDYRMTYGIEQYYLPEYRRQAVEKLTRNPKNRVLVRVKVDARGRAAIEELRVGNRIFRY
jgi:uncharacterized membrane-anchored protein